MNAERLQQIEQLFHAALEHEAEERVAYLREVCGADESLRRQVETLLPYVKRAEDVFELPAMDLAAQALARDEVQPHAALPVNIGHYRIVRLLGEGGMGAVYEAEQEYPRRIVALKVIKPGLANPELLRRFEQESQVLARLQHPGIAQIYEAGTADSRFGRQPYFAMEFIRGDSLLPYAEAHQLNARQRLDLMAKVCEGVHHAHQRGIIHRDLKPGNILVDESGQPKVLDFGVARVTNSDAQATRQTDMGQLVGTLAYMSPEQVLADPLELDMRSDVYALGVILFELLAGCLPYKISGQLHEAVRTIREEAPMPLGSISRVYRGDIETIVAKALEKDKGRRYASAAGMAGDIRRHLNDEPIIARPPSATYQVHKFARRHKALVAGVGAVFVVLIAGIVASTWEATRARRAEHAAVRERDRAALAEQAATEQRDRATLAEQVATKQRDRALSAERSATSERNRAVAAEAQAVEERNRVVAEKQRADTEAATARAVNDFLRNDLLAQAGADTQARPGTKPNPNLTVRTALDRAAARIAGRFNTQPLVEASIRQTIGNAYSELGLYPDAQRHLERALALRSRILGENDPSTLSTMYDLANDLYRYQGKYAQAVPLFNKVLDARRRVLGDEDPQTLETMNRLADLYRFQGKSAEAESLLSKALAGFRRVLGDAHPWTLDTMNNLALVYQRQRKYEQAEPLFTMALEGCRRGLGEEHPETLIITNNLAVLYRNERRYAEAEPLFTNVLAVRRRVLGEEHLDTRDTMNDLALLYYWQGKYADAETLLTKCVEINRRVLGVEHPNTLTSMDKLTGLYQEQGKYAQAETLSTEVLEMRRRVLGEKHSSTLFSMNHLASLYLNQGKYELAETLYDKLLDLQRRSLGAEHPGTLASMNDLALLYLHQGRYAQAEALLREATNSHQKATSPTWERYHLQSLLGASLAGQKEYAEAEPLAVSGYEGMLGVVGVTRALQGGTTIHAASRLKLEQAGAWILQLYKNWGKPEKVAEWTQKLKATDLFVTPKKP